MVLSVNPDKRQDRWVPGTPQDDDRAEALDWFTVLLIRQAQDQGRTLKQIGSAMGRDKAHVSQILSGKLGVGNTVWMGVADWQRRDPGELMSEALAWWETRGRAYKAQVLAERAQDAEERVRKAEDGSGQRPTLGARPVRRLPKASEKG